MYEDYAAPTITTIGSLHDLTLQFKTFGAADGIILVIPGVNGNNVNVDIGALS